MCCQAMTLECDACKAKMSKLDYCKANSTLAGCDAVIAAGNGTTTTVTLSAEC